MLVSAESEVRLISREIILQEFPTYMTTIPFIADLPTESVAIIVILFYM